MTKKRAHNYDNSMSEWNEMFAKIESRFSNQIFFDQMSPTELKKLNEMFRRGKPRRYSELNEDERKAYEKEEDKYAKEYKREDKYDRIRLFLQQIIHIKSDNPNSELYKTAKELLDTVDKAQADPSSVSRYEIRKFRTGCDRCNALIHAEIKAQQAQKESADKKTNRGRPRKYTDDQLKRMLDTYDNLYGSLKDSKAAWEQVAKNFGVKSGDAARVAVASYKKKLKKSR